MPSLHVIVYVHARCIVLLPAQSCFLHAHVQLRVCVLLMVQTSGVHDEHCQVALHVMMRAPLLPPPPEEVLVSVEGDGAVVGAISFNAVWFSPVTTMRLLC